MIIGLRDRLHNSFHQRSLRPMARVLVIHAEFDSLSERGLFSVVLSEKKPAETVVPRA